MAETSVRRAVLCVYPVSMMAQSASVWLAVSTSFERFVAVCRPLAAPGADQATAKARLTLLCVLSFAVAYNLVRFWEFRLELPGPQLLPLLKQDLRYVRLYAHWLYLAAMFCLPFCLMLYFSGAIVREIQRARRTR